MPAYVIVDAEVLDMERAAEYRTLAEPSVRLYGGRYLVEGALPEAAEGTWPASRIVAVVEFPDMARIKEWYGSPEYTRARAVRESAIDMRLLFAEGGPV
ncbi:MULTISPECIES: DUF1330 domain-containing protein [Streptomyces]|uniref:DUF1330 domain-containing protein n=1 Tax=Streptomyces venezuelae TaxID=54571 RepID=A0A5P2BKU7_STRVZ|nr:MULTISPECIES: DUF1330 domain-containing protein [Streptomyces]NEA04037.1 DUF1330 domain-containing protein [Streptomyces sp. SID10116]MYY84312.1 DUF1330 domain-containing protein [Streptomyces sp. SID335]MYZ12311.1 DUF1330 domain-containing protein [Streptomyces sp. SID337]NDZ86286.1 DUF1330 domain-containing protein [Streptomyces sp. SID10115]NEB43794.1 DUF1330 domain-containing protein [Streptomyces sp. SID339]